MLLVYARQAPSSDRVTNHPILATPQIGWINEPQDATTDEDEISFSEEPQPGPSIEICLEGHRSSREQSLSGKANVGRPGGGRSGGTEPSVNKRSPTTGLPLILGQNSAY